jgi:hypothetical protein
MTKSKDTLTEATFWTFEDLLLPALMDSKALRKLCMENTFVLTSVAFEALKTLTNIEDLSLRAENSKELCHFIDKNLHISFKRIRKLQFNAPSRDDIPQCLYLEHPNLSDLIIILQSYGQSFKSG